MVLGIIFFAYTSWSSHNSVFHAPATEHTVMIDSMHTELDGLNDLLGLHLETQTVTNHILADADLSDDIHALAQTLLDNSNGVLTGLGRETEVLYPGKNGVSGYESMAHDDMNMDVNARAVNFLQEAAAFNQHGLELAKRLQDSTSHNVVLHIAQQEIDFRTSLNTTLRTLFSKYGLSPSGI